MDRRAELRHDRHGPAPAEAGSGSPLAPARTPLRAVNDNVMPLERRLRRLLPWLAAGVAVAVAYWQFGV